MGLGQDFQGRSQGFGEDRKGVGHVRRHRMQISHGQGDEFGQTAGFIPEAQDPARRTMAAQPLSAPLAAAAADIDLAHHPLPHPLASGGRHYLAHEFMPQNAMKICVAPGNIDIGLADPGQTDANQGLPGPGLCTEQRDGLQVFGDIGNTFKNES
jgi:hypothetical protein